MLLNEINLFQGIHYEVVEKIAHSCTEEEYAKGTILFEKGEKAKYLYILLEGKINLVIQNGGSLVYSLTESGEVFGWSALIEPGIYTASGISAANLKVVKIQREKLEKIFDLYPHAGVKILKRIGGVFSKRLSNAYRDLLLSQTQEAIASYG